MSFFKKLFGNESSLDALENRLNKAKDKEKKFLKSNRTTGWYLYLEDKVLSKFKFGRLKSYSKLEYTRVICNKQSSSMNAGGGFEFDNCDQELTYEVKFSVRKIGFHGELALQYVCPKCSNPREVSMDSIAFSEMQQRHQEQSGNQTKVSIVTSSDIGAIDY